MDTCTELSNEFCTLRFHKQSLRGAVQDYIIYFKDSQFDLEICLTRTLDVFTELIDHFKDDIIKARLIANVNYIRFNDDSDEESVNYHFGSYSQEFVHDATEFYERHMQKIISRMDSFHMNGSSLLLKKINHIHIAISKLRITTSK